MTEAVRAAIELLHIPSQVRTMRSSPLPNGMHLLLRVAAGEPAALEHAQELTRRPGEVNHKAAVFFIEQILLQSEDSFRNLGLDRTATLGELRAHMALLLKWLHPDLTDDAHKSLLARRVIRAWSNVKTHDPHQLTDGKHRSRLRPLSEINGKRGGGHSRPLSAKMIRGRRSSRTIGGNARMTNLQRLFGILLRLRRRIRPI
jgi:hypothetical protein